MIIAVTGTPGTGKTTLSKLLANKLNFTYINLTNLIQVNELYTSYDKVDETYDVDIEAFIEFMTKYLKKKDNIVLDGHLSHFLPNELIDKLIVCTCELSELNNRLKSRYYSAKKIKDNLEAETFETIKNEAIENNHDIIEISTNKSIEQSLNELINQLEL